MSRSVLRPTVYLNTDLDAPLVAELERCGTRRRAGRFLTLVRLGVAAEQLATTPSAHGIFGALAPSDRPRASSLRITLKLGARAQDLRAILETCQNQSYRLRELAMLGMRREAVLNDHRIAGFPSAPASAATPVAANASGAAAKPPALTRPLPLPSDSANHDVSFDTMIARLRSGI